MDATFTFPGNKILKWGGKSRNKYFTYGHHRGTIISGSEGSEPIYKRCTLESIYRF